MAGYDPMMFKFATSPGAGPELYAAGMRHLGDWLVKRDFMAAKKNNAAYHVVCAVEDFDHIGQQVMGSLEEAGADVRFSCFWPEHEVLHRNPWIDTATINRAYDQDLEFQQCELVVVASAIGAVTPVENMLLRVLSAERRPVYTAIHVIAPISHRRACFVLQSKLGNLALGRISWHGIRLDRKLRPDGSPHPGIGATPSKRAGLDDPGERRSFIPAYIRSLMSSRPGFDGPQAGGSPQGGGGPSSLGTAGRLHVPRLSSQEALLDSEDSYLPQIYETEAEEEIHQTLRLLPPPGRF